MREFGIHSATVRKYLRQGELVARELKDNNGEVYYKILMSEDNVKFFKTHERKGERKKRWHYVDREGNIIWL